MTTVETEHFFLRPWGEEDRKELERLLADPAVRGGRNFPPDRIAKIAEHSLRQWRVDGFGPWAAIEKANGSWGLRSSGTKNGVSVVQCLAADPGVSIQPIGASCGGRDHPIILWSFEVNTS